jgi:flagellar basal-body rod modification protein FlgD
MIMSATGIQSVNSLLPASNTQNVSSSTGSGQTDASNQLGMNSFLTMFTTQLKYQDPTNPMESYQLSAQLAQFSTVEKLSELNTNVKEIQSYLASLTNGQMINLVGKQVTGNNSTLQVAGGKASSASYQLDDPADVTVRISDQQGALVRTLHPGAETAGRHQINWDGCNDAGEKVANGAYTCTVAGVDAAGNAQEIKPTIQGSVYSFRLDQGVPYLILNGADGIKLPIGDIQEVTNPVAG